MRKIFLSVLAVVVLAGAEAANAKNTDKIYLPIKSKSFEQAKRLQTLSGHSNLVLSVAFSPDGKRLATGSADSTVMLWDAITGKRLQTLSGHSAHISSVAFSPDGKLLATGSADKTAMLWDVATGKILRTLSGHSHVIFSLAFSPDGKLLATGSRDNTVMLWDVATGKSLQTLSGHSHLVLSVAFSPDGKLLATGSWDKTKRAMLWDVATGKSLQTLSGHSALVLSVAFSPDGKLLATGSGDKTAMLWDVTSGKRLQTLSGHSNFVYSVAFSPDGKLLATGSADSTVMLWDVDVAISTIARLFKKDEFETTNEYTKRVKELRVPYSSMITLGRYDADKGGFEGEFEGVKAFISVPAERARELAANIDAVYISGNLKYADKDTLELTEVRLTLDPSVPKMPAYALKKPAYMPKTVLLLPEEKPVEDIHQIPDFKSAPQPNDLAIIIGIEKYKGLPKSDFSKSDAGIMKDYLRALGFADRNIEFIVDENASKSSIEKSIEGWLPNRVKSDSRVFVYYSGHGASEPKTGDAYLVPYDGDPNYLEITGYPLKRLYERLGKLHAAEVVVLLDSCFSGAGGRSVLAKGARPLVMMAEGIVLPQNMAVLTAAQGAQISTSSPEKGHGIFTYYFLKALKDGKKNIAEIYEYIKPLVEDEAKQLNVQQSPSISPDIDKLKGRFGLRK